MLGKTEKKMTDTERIDWLEQQANKPGGLLLHDGSQAVGRLGLGLRPGRRIRTLREAIDEAIGRSAELPEKAQIR